MRKFYNQKLKILRNFQIQNPELELKLIISNSIKRKNYYLINELNIKDINREKFNNFFKRRIKGEPISKILKNKEFWSLDFYTNKYVLDPRPETEHIVEGVLKYYLNKEEKLSFCDFGTGSGCIIISLLKYYSRSKGIGIDISPRAIEVAKKNSIKHHTTKRLKLYNKDWKNMNKRFDVIVSNPPYIKNFDFYKLKKEVQLYDPKISLIGGSDGLKKFKEIAPIVNICMKKSAIFLLEIGYRQKKSIEKIFNQNNLQLIEVIRDLQGIERVMVFKKTK